MMEEPRSWQPGRPEGPRRSRCDVAAFLQAVAVVFTSLALSDPAWLLVRVSGQEGVYGVSYFLHHGFSLNFTQPGTPQVLHRAGLYLLAGVTLCCYVGILLGSIAFLIDFSGVCSRGGMGLKVSSTLHLLTVVSSAGSVALCSYLYLVFWEEVEKVKKQPTDFVKLGDSFYFAISAFLASLCAASRSCYFAQRYRLEDPLEVPVTHSEVTTPLLHHDDSPDTAEEYG